MKPAVTLTVLTLLERHRTASSSFRYITNTLFRRTYQTNSSRPSKPRAIIMEDNTRYCITTTRNNNFRENDDKESQPKEKMKKWIKIAFDPQFDTTITHHNRALLNERIANQQQQSQPSAATAVSTQEDAIPPSVLQYQRQLRKIQAADRASKTHVTTSQHLRTIYSDDHIVVTNKPSGILCVPGVNQNKSLLDLVFDEYGPSEEQLLQAAKAAEEELKRSEGETKAQTRKRKQRERKNRQNNNNTDTAAATTPDFSVVTRDNMIVHRLDMDTSGIVIFARNRHAMSSLHEAFRQNKDTKSTRKVYEALLVGWLDIDCWVNMATSSSSSSKGQEDYEGYNDDNTTDNNNAEHDNNNNNKMNNLGGGEINLPLQRDHKHPPFMRVSTPHSEAEAHQAVADLNHNGYKKLIAKRPKKSVTRFRVVGYELWMGHEVTRVELYPGK